MHPQEEPRQPSPHAANNITEARCAVTSEQQSYSHEDKPKDIYEMSKGG